MREMLDELDARGLPAGGRDRQESRAGSRARSRSRASRARFVATRCADEGFPKPHPDMLLHLMERAGVEPRETLMIGDTTHDLELARNAGAAALAVAYGAHPAGRDWRDCAPLATVHSIAELRRWLRANG